MAWTIRDKPFEDSKSRIVERVRRWLIRAGERSAASAVPVVLSLEPALVVLWRREGGLPASVRFL